MQFNSQHQMFSLSTEITGVARPILKKYDLNYFQYLTVYADGSFSILCNQVNWQQFILNHMHQSNEPMVYSHIAQKESLSPNNYYFLWEPNLPSKPVTLAREFNIANGLTFVERYPTHYNMIAFATPLNNTKALDIYLNNIQELQNFIQNFKHDQKKLILEMGKHRLYPSKIQQDVNLHKMLLPREATIKRIAVHYQGKKGYLTFQEGVCLKHLAQGKSYKWIAEEMSISPRTVETYLNRIKHRLDLYSKKDLIALYHSMRP